MRYVGRFPPVLRPVRQAARVMPCATTGYGYVSSWTKMSAAFASPQNRIPITAARRRSLTAAA